MYTDNRDKTDWRDESPTLKQTELFAKLQDQTEYEREEYPQTKGDYSDAITYMIEKVRAENFNTRRYASFSDSHAGDAAHDWAMDAGQAYGY